MKENHIKINKTARFFTSGEAGPNIKRLWVVCHGYGQEVKKFISKFSDLKNEETLIIAPEGLSRFYFGGFNGNIGASWMTKEDREHEIEDYCNFIQKVYEEIRVKLPNLEQTNLLGFSQGGPTITRWLTRFKPEFQNLVLWAADLAHDIDYSLHKDWLNKKKMFFVVGDEDEFITPERIEKYSAFIIAQGLNIESINFKGKHHINRQVLSDLAQSFEG